MIRYRRTLKSCCERRSERIGIGKGTLRIQKYRPKKSYKTRNEIVEGTSEKDWVEIFIVGFVEFCMCISESKIKDG